jgi:mono/diheme cytochrome c family protein
VKEARVTIAAMAVLVVVLFALRAGLAADPERRGFELFPEMARSAAGESFAECPSFAGGTVQQPLLPGVVVRGRSPFPFPATPEGATLAGATLTNPFSAGDTSARVRGAERFAIFCAVCHGSDGLGRTPVIERGMLPPPSLLADRARLLPDGHLFHVLTCGQGNMASYSTQLSSADRWKVILHVRSLQEAAR